MTKITLRYDLPKQFKVSTNKIYSWIHWTKRKKITDYFHNLVKQDCQELKQVTEKVNLRFEFYFKSRYLDSSNCSFMWKCLEDWLVNNWLIKNDTNKYIKEVTYVSVVIDPKERKKLESDYIRIKIKKCQTNQEQ